MGDAVTVTILGARGTVPVEGEDVARYGGATSCVLVRMGGEVLVLDAGTGILELDRALLPGERTVHLLLSHPHFDHLLGLPFCPVLFDGSSRVGIYASERSGLGPRAQLERLMSPPLWPVDPAVFGAAVEYHAVTGDFMLGAVRVRVMEGPHPGGCTMFRLEYGATSVVYASDCELDEDSLPSLREFARNCSLLLCDGQYSDREFMGKRGFGHTSWTMAARLAQECGAKHLRVVHHDPRRTDLDLDAAVPVLTQLFQRGAFARTGEEIAL